MNSITLTLTDAEVADLTAELAVMAQPRPTLSQFIDAELRRLVITPMTQRQQQYREGRAFEGVRELLPKLVQLSPEEQLAVKAQAATAIDALLDGKK